MKTIKDSYNPYLMLEKSRDIEEIEYEKLNVFSYFNKFNNFISVLDQKSNKSEENEKIQTFIKCLCNVYIGNNIHQKINDEISKKTNLLILKGDYFVSKGYFTLSKVGNPTLIRFYSKISENFAKVNIFKYKIYLEYFFLEKCKHKHKFKSQSIY